jgi:hypothetical protein
VSGRIAAAVARMRAVPIALLPTSCYVLALRAFSLRKASPPLRP